MEEVGTRMACCVHTNTNVEFLILLQTAAYKIKETIIWETGNGDAENGHGSLTSLCCFVLPSSRAPAAGTSLLIVVVVEERERNEREYEGWKPDLRNILTHFIEWGERGEGINELWLHDIAGRGASRQVEEHDLVWDEEGHGGTAWHVSMTCGAVAAGRGHGGERGHGGTTWRGRHDVQCGGGGSRNVGERGHGAKEKAQKTESTRSDVGGQRIDDNAEGLARAAKQQPATHARRGRVRGRRAWTQHVARACSGVIWPGRGGSRLDDVCWNRHSLAIGEGSNCTGDSGASKAVRRAVGEGVAAVAGREEAGREHHAREEEVARAAVGRAP
ncbi:hypothetical protein EJB05_31723, partial [Eragrostis curvula]